MSQNHAGSGASWKQAWVHDCAQAIERRLGQDVKLVGFEPVSRQGAVNHHWRLHLDQPAAGPRSLILRARAQSSLNPSGIQAFPGRHLNDMQRQHDWHELAGCAGARVPLSYGVLELEGLGQALLLEDLGPQRPRLIDLHGVALADQNRYLVAALAQLTALHCHPMEPGTGFAPPPVPPLELDVVEIILGAAAAQQLQALLQTVDQSKRPETALDAVPLHGDFRAANVLTFDVPTSASRSGQAQAQAILLDFDFAGVGPAVLDLAWFSAPCWRTIGQTVEEPWLLESYEALGGRAITRSELGFSQLSAQLRWLAIALVQHQRLGQSCDVLFADDPQQHPQQVLADALGLAEMWA